MNNEYTAIIKQEGAWWIGWIEEVPGVNCQEPTHDELISSLQITLKEALEFNRQDALAAIGAGYNEEVNTCDSDVQQYVTELKAENLKLQKKIAKFQVQEVTLNNRITALEEQLKEEQENPKVQFIMNGLYDTDENTQKK